MSTLSDLLPDECLPRCLKLALNHSDASLGGVNLLPELGVGRLEDRKRRAHAASEES